MSVDYSAILFVSDYRDVPGIPGLQVTSSGVARGLFTIKGDVPLGDEWHILPQYFVQRRLYVHYKVNGERKAFLAHRLVLMAFVGQCPENMEGCHFDGNPSNNSLSNLRWDTRKENHADMRRHGTHMFGENHPRAKVDEQAIKKIRYLHSKGLTQEALARRFDLGQSTISSIIRRETWAHIEP